MLVMKTILTLLVVLITSINAFAETGTPIKEFNLKIESYVEVTSPKMDTDLDRGTVVASPIIKTANTNEKSIARLYKFKNSRVKKALAFKTKRDVAKMA